MEDLLSYLLTTPQGPCKFATILTEDTKQLLAIDRYERRALSRRKFAIRALDELRRRRLAVTGIANNWWRHLLVCAASNWERQ